MPPRSKAAASAATEEIDYTAYADKQPTDLQARFTEWILDKTEVDPAGFKTKQAAFEAGARLAVALRMKFQASPENQAVLEERRNGSAQEDEEEAPKPKRKAAARKGRAKAVEPEEEPDEPELDDEDEEDEEPEPEAKPARRTRAASKKTNAPAKPAAGRRRAKATAKSGDAPF